MAIGRGTTALLALGALALAGCQAVAGGEVRYVDAGPGSSAEGGGADGGRDSSALQPQDAGVAEDAGACPCDTSAGVGCCLSAGGAFCTSNGAACSQAGGLFLYCTAYDTNSASQCCWNGDMGAGGSTSYAEACGNRPVACTSSADCNGAACATTTCKGQTVGACGATPPACP